MVGYLTGATVLPAGGACSLDSTTLAGAEAEIAITIGRDVPGGAGVEEACTAVASLAPAIEILDLVPPFDDLEAIIAGNLFHRAVVLGTALPDRPGGSLSGITVRALYNGAEVGSADAAAALGSIANVVRLTADFLADFGERLSAGDRIISGSIAQRFPVRPGDLVAADFGPLGALQVQFVS